jgi:hypothetical protein
MGMSKAMNRLQTISNSPVNLRQLAQAIRASEQTPLTADEYASLLNVLQSPDSTTEIRRNMLILALLDSGASDSVLEYCRNLLSKTAKAAGFSGYEAGSNLALQILLAKSPDKDHWVNQFGQSNAAVLRLVVAEHIASTNPRRGLMMMIEVIPLAGTDHAISDAIDLWLANESDTSLLAAVESRLAELKRKQPASALTAAFQHAREVIINAQ